MADDLCVAVAKAVAKELNAASAAGSFTFRFTAEQSYADWQEELPDDKLHVDVVLVSNDNPMRDLETRGDWSNVVMVDVVVRKQLGRQDQQAAGKLDIEAVNELVKLPRQIEAYFMPKQSSQDGRRLADVSAATWVQIEKAAGDESGLRGLYHREALSQRRYVGWVRLAFSVPD